MSECKVEKKLSEIEHEIMLLLVTVLSIGIVAPDGPSDEKPLNYDQVFIPNEERAR